MKDKNKTPEQLIKELTTLRRRIAEVEATERKHKQTIETLLESKKTLDALINNTSADSILILDARGVILDLNKIAAKRLGKSREKLIGTLADNVLPADIAKRRRSIISQILKTGREVKFEDERDGIWFDAVVYPIADKDGVINKIAIIARDITERKQVEELLRAEHEQAQRYLNVAEVILVALNKKGEITLINRKGNQLLGYKDGELLGKNWFDNFVPLHVRKQVKSVFRKFITGEIKIAEFNENAILTRSDSERIIAWHNVLLKDNQGNIIGTLSSGMDVTERKQMEEALWESEKKYRSVVENSLFGIGISCGDEVLFANPALLRLFGFDSLEELKKIKLLDLVTPASRDLIRDRMKKVATDKPITNEFECDIQRKDGTIKTFLASSQHFTIDGKIYTQTTFQDITERTRSEEALQLKANELRALNERLEFIMEATKTNIDVIDTDFNLIYVDRHWQQVYGDPTGRKCFEYYMGREQPCPTCGIPQALKTKRITVTEEVLPRENNRCIQVHTIPFQESDGQWRVAEFNIDITERKHAEERLRLLSSAVEQSSEGLAIIDQKGNLLFANNSFATMHGYAPDDLVGKHLSIFHTPEQMPSVEAANRHLQKTGEFTGEIWHARRDGTVFPTLMHNALLRDKDGTPLGMIGTLLDITERKQSEEALRDSEKRYKDILNGMNDTAWVIDFDGKFVDVNSAAVEVLGYSREELLSMGPSDIDSTLDAKAIRTLIKEMPTDKIQVFETTHTTKDGRVIPVEIKSSLITYGGKRAILSIARDITERKQAEEALEQTRLLLDAVLDQSPVPTVVVSGQDLVVRFKNRAAIDFLGVIDEPSYLGLTLPQVKQRQTWQDLNRDGTPCDLLTLPLARALRGEIVRNEEYRVIRKDGTQRWELVSSTPIYSRFGELVAALVVFLDITEQKQAEIEHQAHLWFIESMVRVNEAIYGTDDLGKMMSNVLAVVLSIFNCDRASLVYPCDPEAASWRAIMEETRPEYPGALALGLEVPMDPDVVRVFQTLRASSAPVKFGPGSAHPLPAAVAKQFQEQSQLAMAIYPKGDKPWAFVIHQCSFPRIWSPEEERLFQEIGNRLADSLTSLSTYRHLRESEERFRLAFENANVGVCLIDLEGNLTRVNDKMSEIFGYAKEELEQMTVNDISYAEDIDKSPEFMQKTLRGELDSASFEKRYIHKKGHIVTCEVSSSLVRDSGGTPLYFISHVHDISDRIQTQEALKQERDFAEDLIETAQAIVLVLDTKGRIVRFNSYLEKLSGYRLEEVQGKDWFATFLPERNRTLIRELFLKAIGDTKTHGNIDVIVTKDNRERMIEWYDKTLKDADGKITGLLAIGIDVTERMRAEEAQKESELRFRTLFESIPDSVIVHDDTGTILHINEIGAHRLEWTAKDLVGRRLQEIVTSENSASITNHVKETHEVGWTKFETTYVARSGWQFAAEVNERTIKFGKQKAILSVARDISERKRAELSLKESEEKFRKFFENEPTYCYMISPEGIITDVNNAALNALGYTKQELIGMPLKMLYASESLPKMEKLFTSWRKGGKISHEEMTIITKKGEKRIILLSADAIKDVDGKILYSISVQNDITERKQAEEAIVESRQRYQTIVDNINDALYIFDFQGNIIEVNENTCKMLGYDRNELIGANLSKIDSRENGEKIPERIKIVLSHKSLLFEGRHIRKDGTAIPVEVSVKVVSYEGNGIIQGFARDITERKQTEQALRESEERFRKFADEAAFEGIIIHDGEKIIDVNRQFAKMHGYEVSEIISMSPYTTVAPTSRDLIRKYFVEGYEGSYEVTDLRKDGSTFPVEVQARTIPYRGKMIRAVALRDITERKKAEQALYESEEKFRNLAEQSPNMIFINVRGQIVYANKKSLEIMGYELEELYAPDFNFMSLIAPESANKIKELYSRHLQGEEVEPYEYVLLTKQGERVHAINTTKMIFYEGRQSLLGVVTDITERKKAEQDLQNSYQELHEMLLTIVNALASTVEMKDQYTAGHQPRVTELACAIAEEMGLPQGQIEGIRMAALIHDIGKLVVPAEILNKPGRLTDIQYEMVKMHPEAGYDIVKRISFPWPVAEIIRQHHELLNGSGYPHGLAGDQIMTEAKIMTVANVVEAMTSHRPYRPAHDIEVALEEITKNRGILYEPLVVDACLRLFKEKKFSLDATTLAAPTPVS